MLSFYPCTCQYLFQHVICEMWPNLQILLNKSHTQLTYNDCCQDPCKYAIPHFRNIQFQHTWHHHNSVQMWLMLCPGKDVNYINDVFMLCRYVLEHSQVSGLLLICSQTCDICVNWQHQHRSKNTSCCLWFINYTICRSRAKWWMSTRRTAVSSNHRIAREHVQCWRHSPLLYISFAAHKRSNNSPYTRLSFISSIVVCLR